MNNSKEAAPAKSNGKALPPTDGEAWAKVEAAAGAELKQEAKTPAKAKISAQKKTQAKASDDVRTKASEAAPVKAEQKPSVDAEKEIVAEAREAPANPTAQSRRARTVRVKAELPVANVEPHIASVEDEVATETQAAPPFASEDTPAPTSQVETLPAAMDEVEQESTAEAEEEISIDVVAAVADAAPAQAARVKVETEDAGESVPHSEAQIEPQAAPFADFDAIAAEAINYSKKAFENGSALVEKLLVAKSFESAVQIGSDYIQKSCTEFVEYLTKIAALYAKLANGAFKPAFPIRPTND